MIGVALVRETGFLHQLAAERVIHHLQLGTELVEPPDIKKKINIHISAVLMQPASFKEKRPAKAT